MGGVHGGVHLAMGSPIAPVRSPEVLAPCIRGVWANRGGTLRAQIGEVRCERSTCANTTHAWVATCTHSTTHTAFSMKAVRTMRAGCAGVAPGLGEHPSSQLPSASPSDLGCPRASEPLPQPRQPVAAMTTPSGSCCSIIFLSPATCRHECRASEGGKE